MSNLSALLFSLALLTTSAWVWLLEMRVETLVRDIARLLADLDKMAEGNLGQD